MRKTTRIDMHVHTRGSDGRGSPDEIAKNAVEAGIDGLVITDHHRTFTPEGLRVAEACREAGLVVLHGCEYSTNQGHVLIYGVSAEELRLGLYPDMQVVIDKVNAAGGVAIPAHPYHGYKYLLGDDVYDLTGIHAVEVANGQNAVRAPHENAKALQVTREIGHATVGGSDAHDPRYVGSCYTEFRGAIRSSQEFLQALKAGQFRAVTQRVRVAKLLERQVKIWKEQAERKAEREAKKTMSDFEVRAELERLRIENEALAALDSDAVAGHFGEDGKYGTASGKGPLH